MPCAPTFVNRGNAHLDKNPIVFEIGGVIMINNAANDAPILFDADSAVVTPKPDAAQLVLNP